MIEWDDKYSVGISRIDGEHKKLIGIINQVIVAKQHNNNTDGLLEIVNEMIKYAKKHFKTEETYMKEFNYPEYQDHNEEHNRFSNEIVAYIDKMIKGDYQMANEILEYLKQWLVNHIQGTDKKYVDCFSKNGLK